MEQAVKLMDVNKQNQSLVYIASSSVNAYGKLASS